MMNTIIWVMLAGMGWAVCEFIERKFNKED